MTMTRALAAAHGVSWEGADPIPDGLNHGPFGENDLVVPNRHWLYGPSRAMWRVLPPRREKTG
jgi:hypothetical protein